VNVTTWEPRFKVTPNYGRAVRKIEHDHGIQWRGYLTPCEVLALHKKGAIFYTDSTLDWAASAMAEGRSNPRWVYFEPAPYMTDWWVGRGQFRNNRRSTA
jgi:hypothetical protein